MHDSAQLTVETINNENVVDSRLLALELGVNHRQWINNLLDNYSDDIAQFGITEIQSTKSNLSAGRPEKFIYLNEDQCYFVTTLSKNSEKVVKCKAAIVRAFSESRKSINTSKIKKLLVSPALIAAREVSEISNLMEYQPRLCQLLIDSCVNHHIGDQLMLVGKEPMLRGVTEIAEEMGYKITRSNRGNLGKFIKAKFIEIMQQEKRLVEGRMIDVCCYPDTEEIRSEIKVFFER